MVAASSRRRPLLAAGAAEWLLLRADCATPPESDILASVARTLPAALGDVVRILPAPSAASSPIQSFLLLLAAPSVSSAVAPLLPAAAAAAVASVSPLLLSAASREALSILPCSSNCIAVEFKLFL